MMRVKKYFRIFSFILISIFSIGFFSCEKSSSLSQSDSSSKVKKNTHQHSLKIENLAKSKNLEFVESEVENSYTIKNISEEDFLLDKKYRTEIADYICAKNGSFDSYDENSSFFENLKIYPIDLPFSKIDIEEPVLYVFSPNYNSVCSFGFCSDSENWVSQDAYITIFSSTGNLISASSDYSLALSYFDTQLDSSEVYYILVAKSYQNEDENVVNFRIKQGVKGNF